MPAQGNYPAIRQNALLLKSAEDPKAAQAFHDYLKSEPATKLLKAAGYSLKRVHIMKLSASNQIEVK
jgi:ABC-type molybdate transport system substrate-binding protein